MIIPDLTNILLDKEKIIQGSWKPKEKTSFPDRCVKRILQFLNYATSRSDPSIIEHTRRVGNISKNLMAQLGQPNDSMYLVGELHDAGKALIDQSILLAPRRLTNEELTEMQKHPLYAQQIFNYISSIIGSHPLIDLASTVALNHHEQWAGTGYPYQKRGEEIPIEARVTAIADVYDAMTSERSYKRAYSQEKALDVLRNGDERIPNPTNHFDPMILEIFLKKSNIILN